MKLVLVAAALALPAAAPPARHAGGAGWSSGQVRVHRGTPTGTGRWHHWPEKRHQGRGGWGGYGYPGVVYAGDGYADDVPLPRPSGVGFFEDGDAWVQGHRVVYDYDRGYPYDHYRDPRARVRSYR
ncbi:MAG TPA: hypothetical protein VGC56_19180 [Allosphingosinicella sp.]